MPDLVHLVSFPRTGSHWLRVLLEDYSNRPLKGRSFKRHWSRNYLLTHTHDNELSIQSDNVIYLYRDPVPTIYSQLNYYNQSINDLNSLCYWTSRYSHHLCHWLILRGNNPKGHQLNIKYSDLKDSPFHNFQLICEMLSIKYDENRFRLIYKQTTKDKVKSLSSHDKQVVDNSSDYNKYKKEFRLKNEILIWSIMTQCAKNSGINPTDLKQHFEGLI